MMTAEQVEKERECLLSLKVKLNSLLGRKICFRRFSLNEQYEEEEEVYEIYTFLRD